MARNGPVAGFDSHGAGELGFICLSLVLSLSLFPFLFPFPLYALPMKAIPPSEDLELEAKLVNCQRDDTMVLGDM